MKKAVGKAKSDNLKQARRKTLGEYLLTLRESKGYSIQRVSKETGISDPFLYQLEKGTKSLTNPEFFNKLARYYDIEVQELLKRAGYIPYFSHEEDVAKAIRIIIRDKSNDLDEALFLRLNFSQKISIVDLYEKAAKKTILDPAVRLFG